MTFGCLRPSRFPNHLRYGRYPGLRWIAEGGQNSKRRHAGKIGCTPETLHRWVRRAERDRGQRDGQTTDERERIKALERENRELKQANEILRKASAYFAQAELDRRPK